MRFSRIISAVCATLFAFSLVACADETGKYQIGPDDPALKVTKGDLAKVNEVLERKSAEDRAKGLIKPPPAAPRSTPKTAMPEGHPPVEVARAAPPVAGASTGPKAANSLADQVASTLVGGSASSSGSTIKVRKLSGRLPQGWKSVPPSSQMREAEIQIPAQAGDPEPGLLSVFYFGTEAGSIQANITRWIGQFSQPDGSDSAKAAKSSGLRAGAMEAVLLEVAGTMAASNMPNAPATPERPNWRMLAAIIMTDEGPYFFKGTGPDKTMAAERDRMRQFIESFGGGEMSGSNPGAPSGNDAPQPAKETNAVPPSRPPMSAPAKPAPGDAPQPAKETNAVPPSRPPMPAPAKPSQDAQPAGGGPIDMKAITGTLPGGWVGKPPSSSMRLAEIVIPPSPGDTESGIIAAFYFGPNAGGIEDNINRWYGQMTQPDGKETKDVALRETLKAGDMDVILIDATGTMAASNMPGAPQTGEKPNSRLLGAIVITPEGPYFLKGVGPAKTMADNREKMVQFVTGLKKK